MGNALRRPFNVKWFDGKRASWASVSESAGIAGRSWPARNIGTRLFDLYTAMRRKPMWPTFRDGKEIMRAIDACLESSSRQKWVDV